MSALCKSWDISVAICTYNRCQSLLSALDSVLSQDANGILFEVIVVDNNSRDDTKQVVDSFIGRGHSNLRYTFEPRQGLSHARNAAVAEARSSIVAFIDDDVRVARNWVSTIKRAFDDHPEAAWVGGKVLPCWPSLPPSWLTRDQWSPLAIVDYGDLPFYTSDTRQTCLVGANLAIRRDVLEQCGGFEPNVQRVKDSIGSMEDHELQMRLWKIHRRGLYVPELLVFSDVTPTAFVSATTAGGTSDTAAFMRWRTSRSWSGRTSGRCSASPLMCIEARCATRSAGWLGWCPVGSAVRLRTKRSSGSLQDFGASTTGISWSAATALMWVSSADSRGY